MLPRKLPATFVSRIFVILVIAVLLISASCIALFVLNGTNGRRKESARTGKYGTKDILIGFSMDSFVEERRARDRDVFVATAHDLGASVNVQIGDEDPGIQESQILFLLDAGVDVLVVIPSNPDGLGKAMAEAKRRGVPVLAYDRLIRNANADLYLGFDAERAGELQAEAFVAARRTGHIVLYDGPASDPNSVAMHRGALKVLVPLIDKGDIVITADHQASERRSEEAYAVVDGLLSSGNRFDGVLAVDDMAAEAIIRALSVRRLAGSVFVAGADADLAACQRIAEGTQSMTVYRPIDQIAAKAAELAVYLARKDRVTVHNAIWDGTYRVPFYELEPIAVDRSLLKETIVKDGFHLESDIYRNVLGD
ncbi:MAG TPA: substrate-binding domain-containing protein [bacterium]|nr:substrate-binding domain-containing protein [bacterium]